MKTLYHSSYRFFKPDHKPERIVALSDVHYSGRVSADMRRALNFAKRQSPALITISGDLVDNLNCVSCATERNGLDRWLTQLGEIAPVCICIGMSRISSAIPAISAASHASSKVSSGAETVILE